MNNSLGDFRAFGVIWFSQMISLLGSHLTGFALGVWVYQVTKSATAFSLISFFTIIPEILLSPIAGVIVDRWDKKKALLLGSIIPGICTGILILLSTTNQLQLWIIYIVVATSSAFQSIQIIALTTIIPSFIPKRHLTRANGLVELGTALAMVIAPSAAGAFLFTLGLSKVMLINVALSTITIIILLIIRLQTSNKPVTTAEPEHSFFYEVFQGWRYLKGKPELLALLYIFAITNFTIGIVQVLLPPMILSFASPRALGLILSCGGIGIVLGSLLIIIWGGPKRKVRAILGFSFIRGIILFLGVLQPNTILIGGAVFIFLFCSPIILSCNQTIWQTKVLSELQGRALAIRRMVAWSSLPLAYLVAGPLADYGFEQLMMPDRILGKTVGSLIGTGPGRGVALLFIILGILTLIVTTAGFQYSPLSKLEESLPDVIEPYNVSNK